MGIYEVSIRIKKSIEEDWLGWMKEVHMKEVVSSGYFTQYELFKVIIPNAASDEVNYQIHYRFEKIEDYYEYAEKISPDLQRKHAEKFKENFSASRSILSLV